jgi:catechol 2,3-dioxygenase-like lactoylglutathione lyase family enzyme/ketosteroid isomerase-like protein
MPHIDTLKKQAKQLVRWHKDRVYTVGERIRAGLPRAAGLTDAQVLAAPFTLADAQAIIAREQGFADWAALKAGHIDTPTDPGPAGARAEPQARLRLVEAMLFVSDVAASCRYFEEVLGFATVFTYGEPAFFGQVARDGVPLNLRHVDGPVFVGDIRAREDLLAAQIGVSNLKSLYAEFKAAGADFHQPLKKHPWGGQDFVVRDPDGNLISFGWGAEPADTQRPAGWRDGPKNEANLAHSPLALAISFIDAINRGDVERLAALMADDYVLQVFDEAPRAGRAGAIAGWRGYLTSFPDYVIHPQRCAAEGPRVAILGATSGSHLRLPDAEELKMSLIWLCETAGGKVRSWRLVADTAEARAAHGLE